VARVIVLDASVLIAHLDGRDRDHQRAVELLRAHATELIGTSQISLAETLVAPARAGRLEDAQEALEKLSVRELALKLPDCCVLLTAEDHHGGVASFDQSLCERARGLGIPVVD
jgi:predicted nucleic acid-binding protein